jgi:hypothetical protein
LCDGRERERENVRITLTSGDNASVGEERRRGLEIPRFSEPFVLLMMTLDSYHDIT